MAGAKELLGPKSPREAPAAMWYGRRYGVESQHVIGQAAELIAVGVGAPLLPLWAQIPKDEQAERQCAEKLREMGVEDGFCLISPGAGWGAKQWPAAKYEELQAALEASGRRVLVNDGSSTIEELIALTRRAGLAIGGDTGPVHLAAALGVPVVALFGPTDPARNGPQGFVGARVRVLRHESSGIDYKRHEETEAGLAKIEVDEVLTAAMEMWDEAERHDG
jgi:heptosyltransferase-1